MIFALYNCLVGDEFVEFDVEEFDGPFGLVLLSKGLLVFGQFFVDGAGKLINCVLELFDLDLLAVDVLVGLLELGYLDLVLNNNLVFYFQNNCLQDPLLILQLLLHLLPDTLPQLFQVLVFDHILKKLAEGIFGFGGGLLVLLLFLVEFLDLLLQ